LTGLFVSDEHSVLDFNRSDKLFVHLNKAIGMNLVKTFLMIEKLGMIKNDFNYFLRKFTFLGFFLFFLIFFRDAQKFTCL
jgi:hypothetical protein